MRKPRQQRSASVSDQGVTGAQFFAGLAGRDKNYVREEACETNAVL